VGGRHPEDKKTSVDAGGPAGKVTGLKIPLVMRFALAD
jgi:hypothetical protein